jgi:cyclic pyranopterin phosphate synthase
MNTTKDSLQRPLRDLRISVTDRCNMRCGYCMPREVFGAGFAFMERSELLRFEEIARLAAIAATLGVRKLRLTGGEPLLRRQLERLVAMLSEVSGIEEIALTTNGVGLAERAGALARAGLTRATISLDALQEPLFRRISDTRLPLARVLEGIEAAQGAGLTPVKVNMVVRRGINDEEVMAMAEHFRGRAQILRFIEYMDVGESNGWRAEEVVPGAEIIARISARWPLAPLPAAVAGEAASRYAYRDGAGEIGVIASVTRPFCSGCTRARLSADGRLHTCLFARSGTDLRALLRGGASDEQIAATLRSLWVERADRYSELRARLSARPGEPHGAPARGAARRGPRGATREGARIEMSYIGG